MVLGSGATQVASLYAVLALRDEMSGQLHNARGALEGMAENMQRVGTQMMGAGTAMGAALGVAVNAAMGFEERIVNIGSLTGATREEMDALSATILGTAQRGRASANDLADSYYDIVSGVSDASTHMAIFEAAIATSEAGNAALTATTSGLVAVMNSYRLEADQASHASDVLTAIVQAGVTTMDQLVSAMPNVTGIANEMGVALDELGGSLAFITKQGKTSSEASTQLRAALTALINPNETLKAALDELGVANGRALIEMEGFQGALEAIAGTSVVAEEGLGKTFGSVEALSAVLALTGEEAAAFLEEFTGSVEGATEAARAIQMESAAAQFDILKASVGVLSITIGNALLPAIANIMKDLTPVVHDITAFAAANPQLTQSVAILAAGLVALGTVLVTLGTTINVARFALGGLMSMKVALTPVVYVLTTAITLLKGALLLLISPIGLAVAAGVTLGVAVYSLLEPLGGLETVLRNAGETLRQLAAIILAFGVHALERLNNALGPVRGAIESVAGAFRDAKEAVEGFFNSIAPRNVAVPEVYTQPYEVPQPMQPTYGDTLPPGYEDFYGGNQAGTHWTGSGAINAIAGYVHNQEAVVPAHGMRVVPSPGGLMLEGGGGSGSRPIIIQNATFNGVEDIHDLYDQIQRESRRRGR